MAKKPAKYDRYKVPLGPGADRYTPYHLADVSAVKALAAGTANEDQQIRAYNWIIEEACMYHHTPYTKGDAFETTFNVGRQFVGREITKLVKIDFERLEIEE